MQLFRHSYADDNGFHQIQPTPSTPHAAPEISASTGVTAVLVLAMALAILKGKRC